MDMKNILGNHAVHDAASPVTGFKSGQVKLCIKKCTSGPGPSAVVGGIDFAVFLCLSSFP